MLSLLPSPLCVKWVPFTAVMEAVNSAIRWLVLPFKYSTTTGFFFCGMMLDVPATRSGKWMSPNSGVAHT